MREITPEMLKTVEANWATRNEQWLGKDADTPRKVTKCYTDGVQITLEELEHQMDWDYFDETDDEEQTE